MTGLELCSVFPGGYSVTLLLGFDSGLPHSFPATDTMRAIGAARLSGPRSRAASLQLGPAAQPSAALDPTQSRQPHRRCGKRLGAVLADVVPSRIQTRPKELERTEVVPNSDRSHPAHCISLSSLGCHGTCSFILMSIVKPLLL